MDEEQIGRPFCSHRSENLSWKADFPRDADTSSRCFGTGGQRMAWEAIVEEWRGSISEEAISEAVRLANEAFREHAHELGLETAAT